MNEYERNRKRATGPFTREGQALLQEFQPFEGWDMCRRIRLLNESDIDLSEAYTDALRQATDRLDEAHAYEMQRMSGQAELLRLLEAHAR